jgi:tRNA-binding protein
LSISDRTSASAQITDLYKLGDLVGKQVVAVPKQIGPFMSECLVTGFHREDNKVVLATVDSEVPNGAKLS